jgi:hypothetical protein
LNENSTPAAIVPQAGAVSVVGHKPSAVAGHNGRMYPVVGASLLDCPTNLDLTSTAGKALALAAGNPSDMEFDKNGVLEIVATHYLIFPEERVDPETGEVGTFARTVLFDQAGDIFRTSAAHAPHRIQSVLDLFGPEAWAKGIPFVIRERKGKRGFTYHDIRIKVSPT